MDYISVKKLSEKYKIDFYQFISYLEFLNIPIEIKNNIKTISNENIALIDKFISTYTTNQIAYMKSHNVQPFFNGTLLLDLRKKYNLNDKQFKSKCVNADLEFKYVYSNEECKKFDEYINKKLNKVELREEKYIKEGWIPLRDIIDELGDKYNFSVNTGKSMIHSLNIEVYKPLDNLSFLSKEQKEKFEEFLKKFDSAKERKLFFQEQTCMKKYGVSNPSCSNEARNKISNVSKRKINFATSKNLITAKELANMFDKDKHTVIDVIQMLNIEIITFETDNHYYISRNNIFMLENYFSKTEMSGKSYSEKELVDFVKSIYSDEIMENTKRIIPPKELDIYIPQKNLAIEFNGVHWHDENHVDKNYHLTKTNMCNEKGIDLIHVFEDDWLYKKEIVKSMIASRLGIYQQKIFARKCKCQILDYKLYKELLQKFFNKNHLQGFTKCDIFVGLFYNDELVQCMGFNKKGWHDGNVELTRMVSKMNAQVVGGFSKLMSFVKKVYGFTRITSYVYRAWFNGKGYLMSGFKIVKENPPSYSYVLNGKRIHKSHFRKNKLKKMYECGKLKCFDENKSEHEIMLQNNIYRIYDCGTIKVIYEY